MVAHQKEPIGGAKIHCDIFINAGTTNLIKDVPRISGSASSRRNTRTNYVIQ